jgi:hypothetical protein
MGNKRPRQFTPYLNKHWPWILIRQAGYECFVSAKERPGFNWNLPECSSILEWSLISATEKERERRKLRPPEFWYFILRLSNIHIQREHKQQPTT